MMGYVDYEELHKVTITKLQEMVNSGKITVETACGICADFVPESEGERIRKALIDGFKRYNDGTLFNGCLVRDIIAWLEKQGNNMGISEATKQKLEDNLNRALEKETSKSFNEFLDEQGEQKPADNDPKFHEGDWIINNEHNNVAKVLEINNEQYRLDYGDTVGTITIALIDNDYHLWTIQDAKDGDVLACPNDAGDRDVVFIFKNINSDEGWVFCFCASDANGCFCTNNDYVGNSNSTNISPATKEQRDLLFQKMHEAGYEWDEEKKELKKIEQNPAENKGMNLVEEEMTPFQKKVFCIIDTSIEEEQGLKQVCEELLALAANEIEQEPDDLKTKAGNWYVCDMEVMNENMVTAFRRGEIYYCPKDGYLDVGGALFKVGCLDVFRLATEKEIPQPKQNPAWSEEDDDNIMMIEDRLSDYLDYTREDCTLTKHRKNSLKEEVIGYVNWLKSLKERYTWKPSELQIEALAIAIRCGIKLGTWEEEALKDLIEQLKKLRKE